ncbi:hypothetical protein NAC44_11915 [Allorhizobium sp. BGMRC 0089]|uniref:hypothetical protein n=1 Tax=Allorhizobium sonneratiae TaxID=2934936 RepID=UPI0020333B39|nr:hypothetical protein [Allorhizobium sonneratiae]MCM2293028.1 hypothetical protein [Allorhizobium sonneratiae]
MAYSVQYLPANVIEALRGSHQLGIFTSVKTDPALHLWFGVNDIPAQIDSIDEAGTVYLGAGYLNGLPTLETQINGTADSVEFSLSGVDPATGNDMLDSIPSVRGSEFYVALTTLDDYYQPLTNPIPIWQGKCSHTGEGSQAPSGSSNRSMTVSLIVTTGSDTRSRPSYATWTPAQQQAQYPGDLGCDQTARLARGVQPVWPNY